MNHPRRIALVDIARTAAIVAMVVFHFTYDLEMFGFAPRGTMASPEWIRFAKNIAGSFIFLSGLSLVLAGLNGPIVARKYLKRLVKIGAAAIAVSLGTYVAMGSAFVRFGILHHLFVASVLGLVFLNRPFWIAGLLGGVLLALPFLDIWPLFDSAIWLWLGQTRAQMPSMVDYIPVLPWFGMFLFGMAAAHALHKAGLWGRVAGLIDADTKLVRALSWPGKHSLAVYLIHQPVLFGSVSLARMLIGWP